MTIYKMFKFFKLKTLKHQKISWRAYQILTSGWLMYSFIEFCICLFLHKASQLLLDSCLFMFNLSLLTCHTCRDWRGGFFSIEDEWGWVWAETTEDERVRVSPNSTKQRANMIFECLIFLLSDVLNWWKYIPSLVVSWFPIIIIVINCTGFIYTILLR